MTIKYVQIGTKCHNRHMWEGLVVAAIACSLPAIVIASIAIRMARVTPHRTLEEEISRISRELLAIKEVDLPRTQLGAEAILEKAEAILDSAETKRRRAAAARSKTDNGGQVVDAQFAPWDDPSLTTAQKRALLESLVNRGS